MAEELNGKAIDMAGDELTMPEAARIVSDAMGKEVVFAPTPIEEVRGFSEDFALMLEWFDGVGYDADISGNAKAYGIEPTRFPSGPETSTGADGAFAPWSLAESSGGFYSVGL
jgi:uncharacterized protein YbjT (DUF2867 family)